MKSVLEIVIDDIEAKRQRSSVYFHYYAGDHRTQFHARSVNPHAALFDSFTENLCSLVVDSTVDSLVLTGLVPVDNTDTVGQAAATTQWNLWTRERYQRAFVEWIRSCEISGEEAVVITWPTGDGKNKVWFVDSTHCSVIRKDSDPSVLETVAILRGEGDRLLSLFYQDRVESYVADNPRYLSANNYRLIDTIPNPLGRIPASTVHVQSDIKKIIDLQDLLNSLIINGAILNLKESSPLRVFLGLECDVDENGQTVAPFDLQLERNLFLPGAVGDEQKVDVKELGGKDATSLLTKQADSIRSAIARLTRTPYFLLSGTERPPSGEALRTSEAPFLQKLQSRGNIYGDAVADSLSDDLVFKGLDSTGLISDRIPFDPIWQSPLIVSRESDSRIVQNLVASGVKLDHALIYALGWDKNSAESAVVINQTQILEDQGE